MFFIGGLRPGFQPLIFLCTTFGKQGIAIVYNLVPRSTLFYTEK